jgi:hypothetical protein
MALVCEREAGICRGILVRDGGMFHQSASRSTALLQLGNFTPAVSADTDPLSRDDAEELEFSTPDFKQSLDTPRGCILSKLRDVQMPLGCVGYASISIYVFATWGVGGACG